MSSKEMRLKITNVLWAMEYISKGHSCGKYFVTGTRTSTSVKSSNPLSWKQVSKIVVASGNTTMCPAILHDLHGNDYKSRS